MHSNALVLLVSAIDSNGATIDFLLSTFRDADAAKRLFRKALGDPSHPQPRVINTDLAPIYSSAIPDSSKKEGTLRKRCRHRPVVQYLNNILEQDHRAIKRRVNAFSMPAARAAFWQANQTILSLIGTSAREPSITPGNRKVFGRIHRQ